jgi:hypothetical protein
LLLFSKTSDIIPIFVPNKHNTTLYAYYWNCRRNW